MTKWIKTLCSEVGKKKENQDFVAARSFRSHRRKIDVLIVCDGVGGHLGGSQCSKAIGEAVLGVVEKYLSRRKSGRSLDKEDANLLGQRLASLPITNAPKDSATTLALALFDRKNGKSGHSIVTAWVGDSHVYLFEIADAGKQLTSDHHDEEGRLTRYITGDGRVHGGLEIRHFTANSPYGICLTTDGVHEKCQLSELYNFLLFCIDHRVTSDGRFSEAMTLFLGDNIDDNYSAVLLYHPLSSSQVIKTAAKIAG